MQKTYYFFIFCFVAGFSLPVSAQLLDWGRGFGGESQELVNGVASDPAGNVYAVGNFLSTRLTDPDTSVFDLGSQAGADIFITKTDEAGNFLWGKSIGGLSQQHAYAVVADTSGHIYVTGHYQGNVDFDPDPLRMHVLTTLSTGSTSMFLLKMDTAGNFIWAKDAGVPSSATFGYASGRAIAIDTDGNILITGDFASAIDFDPGPQQTTLTAAYGAHDIFVAKYDPSGNYVWARSFKGQHQSIGYAVKADGANNVYITGSFQETVDFNPGLGTYNLTSTGGLKDVFLCKLTREGAFIRAFALGGAEDDYASGLVLDDSANVYLTGRFQYTVDFDPDPVSVANMTSNNLSDVFLSKYDSAGNFVWVNTFGSTGWDMGMALAIDKAANLYVGGGYTGTVDFDPDPNNTASLISSGSATEFFLAKYDRNGDYIWATGNGSGDGHIRALAPGEYGALYAAGVHTGSGNITIGATSVDLRGIGNTDVFILKFGCDDKSAPSFVQVTTCDSFTFSDNVYYTSGIYTHMFRNIYGCDSLVTLDLQIRDLDPMITVSKDTLATMQPYATYRWLLDGDTITGAIFPIHIAIENGDYQVVVSQPDGCIDTSAVYTVNNVSVNDPNHKAAQITVYPNPAHDVLHVVSTIPGGRMALCNLAGKRVAEATLPATMDLRGIAKGMYLLMAYDQEGRLIHTGKVVRQ